MASAQSKKVAIVGSGCAGIAALWGLRGSQHDVFLYEADNRLGGHTNTVIWKKGEKSTNVDTGFIVLNSATYPNFINFLKAVEVPFVPTEMTFGVSRDHGLFEWAGASLGALFCQRRNLLSGRMWRMVFDIVRFNQFALDLLRRDGDVAGAHEESIGDYLCREGYSAAFRDDYLIPMTAAVWSTDPDKCSLEFPAITLVRFLWNHHLLSTVAKRPDWLTIPTGSRSYIEAALRGFPSSNVFLNSRVLSVSNGPDGRVLVHLEGRNCDVYDHVIVATHGNQAYSIIQESATTVEKEVLSQFRTSPNTAVLHSDLALMPVSRAAWSSWNYLTLSSPRTGDGHIDRVSLTYNMNILQHIPTRTFGHVLVTLNPLHEPDPATVQGRYTYAHPLYDAAAVRAQAMLPKIQNKRGISYAGAWTKYGFHEDGFSSGLVCARDHLGAELPFPLVDSTFGRGKRPELGIGDWLLRVIILLVQILVVDLAGKLANSAARVVGWRGGRTGTGAPGRDKDT